MDIGILGTGIVGNTIGTKLITLGHRVKMGSRTASNEKAADWVSKNGPSATQGTFEEAARFGGIVFICTGGAVTLDAVELAGSRNFAGKTVIDISNPLDFSKGMPPTQLPHLNNTTSLGEEVQNLLSDAFVVKTLNTVTAAVMVNPSALPAATSIFVSGNSAEAKHAVSELLSSFGWQSIIDLGDISSARGTEQFLTLWVRLMFALGTPMFNISIVK